MTEELKTLRAEFERKFPHANYELAMDGLYVRAETNFGWLAYLAGHAAAQPKPVEWVKCTQFGEGKYTGHAWITDSRHVYHGRVDQGFPIVAHISGFDGWTHYAPITPPAPPEQKE